PGVDRAKIQAEIKQLQGQLSSNASAASFSGENWLSVDSSASGYNATKSIVGSFTRAADGSVSVGTISVDTSSTKLFDANDQSGILDTEATTTNGSVDFAVSTLDISTLTNSDDDLEDLDQMISFVDTA